MNTNASSSGNERSAKAWPSSVIEMMPIKFAPADDDYGDRMPAWAKVAVIVAGLVVLSIWASLELGW